MLIFKTIRNLEVWLEKQDELDKTIGFVPTMGALHDGHLSLINASKTQDITICSIFVNPTQFNDPQDYLKYPVTIESDIEKLAAAGVTALFLPEVEEIYPDGLNDHPMYELGTLENSFEGSFRPGHFQGVCQVMDRLLSIIQPDNLYMGQKDYQQCMVVQQLIQLKQFEIQLQIIPTLREESGLAMSSRNVRLTAEEHAAASAIYTTLNWMKANLRLLDATTLETNARQQLLDAGFYQVDYCQPANPATLSAYRPGDNAVLLCAAFIGKVRLIDNILS